MLLVFACAMTVASGMLRSDEAPRVIRLLLWLLFFFPFIGLWQVSISFLQAIDGIALTVGAILACWSTWLFASSWPRMSRRWPALSPFTIDGALDQVALRAAERTVRNTRSRLRRLESRRTDSERLKAVAG
jgi:hypothetical protein